MHQEVRVRVARVSSPRQQRDPRAYPHHILRHVLLASACSRLGLKTDIKLDILVPTVRYFSTCSVNTLTAFDESCSALSLKSCTFSCPAHLRH
jgi:hypothetical protein